MTFYPSILNINFGVIMKALSMLHRRCTMAMFVAAITALMALFSSGTANAQFNCEPCAGSATYRVTVGAWPVSLGSFSVRTGVINMSTGIRTTYLHSSLNAGSVVTQTFNSGLPSQNFQFADLDVIFCGGAQTFSGIACNTLSNPITYCYQITCNGLHYCLKVRYIKGGSPSPCVDILIEAQQVFSSPWNCSPSFCTPSP